MHTTCLKCHSTNTQFRRNDLANDSGIYACHDCGIVFRGPIKNSAATVPGVGPDAPVVVNSAGAKQSASPYRLDLIPPLSLLDVAAVLCDGANKYGANNWRGIPVSDHLNHALVHIYAYLSGDTQDNHLGHAACRMMMAHEQHLKQPTYRNNV